MKRKEIKNKAKKINREAIQSAKNAKKAAKKIAKKSAKKNQKKSRKLHLLTSFLKNRKIRLTDSDIRRSSRYMDDLANGLATIETYPQGVTIFGSARFSENNFYYQKARELGAKLAAAQETVITGGGPGIMEAANRGAFENGGRSIGLNIKLRTEQDLNPYTNGGTEFHYFFARKVMLTFSAKAYVFFPGGFGTLDEFSEVLELVHTAKMERAPIFLFGSEYWRCLDQWFGEKMSEWNLIETGAPGEINETGAADQGIVERARDLYKITDDVDEIVAAAIETKPHDVSHLAAHIRGESR